jgi:hypothetical protein
MRVILGNEITIRAIEEGKTNPWPDGTIFAKLAWDQLRDNQGTVRTGAFKQVEFMIRDGKKYASTDGWGWGRWRGISLVPYGKNPMFTTECMNCHQPMMNNDFVFTFPIHPSSAPILRDIMKWKLWGSIVNKNDGSMSVLYSNDSAVVLAGDHNDESYPESSRFALVTWREREDKHWFGANIPAAISCIELVKFDRDRKGLIVPVYEKFEAHGDGLSVSTDTSETQTRMKFILSLHAAVLP